jgi:hypothetical protein
MLPNSGAAAMCANNTAIVLRDIATIRTDQVPQILGSMRAPEEISKAR